MYISCCLKSNKSGLLFVVATKNRCMNIVKLVQKMVCTLSLTSPEDLEGWVPTDSEFAAGVFSALCAVHLDEVHWGIVLLEDAGGLLELGLHPLAVSTPRGVEHH